MKKIKLKDTLKNSESLVKDNQKEIHRLVVAGESDVGLLVCGEKQ